MSIKHGTMVHSVIQPTEQSVRMHISVEVRCYANGTYAGPYIHIHPKNEDSDLYPSSVLDAKEFQKMMGTADLVIQAFNNFVKSQKKK